MVRDADRAEDHASNPKITQQRCCGVRHDPTLLGDALTLDSSNLYVSASASMWSAGPGGWGMHSLMHSPCEELFGHMLSWSAGGGMSCSHACSIRRHLAPRPLLRTREAIIKLLVTGPPSHTSCTAAQQVSHEYVLTRERVTCCSMLLDAAQTSFAND